MTQPLIMYNSITSSSGNESQAIYDISHLSMQNQISYSSLNLSAQNQARYHDSSHLSSQNQPRYEDSSQISAQNQTRNDSPNLSAQIQTRYNSPHLSTQNEVKSDSAHIQAQPPHDRLYASSPAVQPHGLYSNQGRFDPQNMTGQQQTRFDATNTLLAQQQARYYTHLQTGYYTANSMPNAPSVFHSPNMLSHYQPGFYYNPITQQMLLGNNISPGYPYPFQSYNLNSAYGGNAYFNMNNQQPVSVNHQQLPIQQAVRIKSPSTTSSNLTSMSPDSQKNDKKKTKQVKRKQKENEPKASKPQPRKKRKKQVPVVKGPNEAESASLFPHAQNFSKSVTSPTSADLMQNLQIYKEHIGISQQDLLGNSTQPKTDVTMSTYNQNGFSLQSEPNLNNVQKCNPSSDSGQNYRLHDNWDKHLDQKFDLDICTSSDHRDNISNENAKVTENRYSVGSQLNTSNEKMNCPQASSEKQDQAFLSEIVNQDKMQNEKNHKDFVLQMPVSDNQPSSSKYDQFENTLQTVYQGNTYYNNLYKEVVDLSVKRSENKSLNSAYQTKIDCGLNKSQLFEFSITSSSKPLADSTQQSWIQDGTKDLCLPKGNDIDANDKNIFNSAEVLCQSVERQFTDCENTCDYNMPKEEQFMNMTHPVGLLNQKITNISNSDKGKKCSTGSEQEMDHEQFPRYAGYKSCVTDGNQDALKNTSISDYNRSYRISDFDFNKNVSAPRENIYQTYHNKPTDFSKSDSCENRNRDIFYCKDNSQILNCETISTNQILYINTKESSQILSQFDSPVEIQVYPENKNEDLGCKQFLDSQIHQYTQSTQQSHDSNVMQTDSIASSEKKPASFSTSSIKADIHNNYSMQTLNHHTDAITGSENTQEESINDNFQADNINGKIFSHDDFDSKWEIIYSSESKEKPNPSMIEPIKLSEKSHELNMNQYDFYKEYSKDISSEQKRDQYLYEHFQRCSLPGGTAQDKIPTPSEDLESKWELMYSKEKLNDKKCANSLELEYQIISQSAKHSVEAEDYKITAGSSIQSLKHCQQNAECTDEPIITSCQLKIKEENVDLKCTSSKASIVVERVYKYNGFIADVAGENYMNESSVALVSSKVKEDLNHENATDVQPLKARDVDNEEVNSVKLKLFFTQVVKRSAKGAGKQNKEAAHACRMKSKQTQILSFFKKDNSSKNQSVDNIPFACHKSPEIYDKEANAANVLVVSENSAMVTELGKPMVTWNGNQKLEAKTCDEKHKYKGGSKMFMSRGKQILHRSQEQSTATLQCDMLNKVLTFKTPVVSKKTPSYHKKISLGCKRNKRQSSAKIISKVLAAVSLKDTPGSKVCPSIVVKEIKYLSPLNREFSFNAQTVSRYLVIKVEDMTRLYKPVVSQMTTVSKSTSARQEASVYHYTGTSSSNLRVTTFMDINKVGNSCSEKTSVMVPAVAKKVCDICGCCYSCTIDQHMNGDKHQSCINKAGFYSELDKLISSIGCIDKLINSLNTHSTSTISELVLYNTKKSREPVSNHSKSELCMSKADHDNQFYYTVSQSTKSKFQKGFSVADVRINKAFKVDNFIDKTRIVQAARLNVIKAFTTSRKRKNVDVTEVENTVVFKQRKTSSKQCCTNIGEATTNCDNLSVLFHNINLHSAEKNLTSPDTLKDKTIFSINEILPDMCSKSVNRPKRQVKLPRFIKVKKPKSKVVAFCVPSPKKVKILSLAACENLFQQCIDELKNDSSVVNSRKLFSFC